MIPTCATTAWRTLLRRLLDGGAPVAPRGCETLELLCCTSAIDLRHPLVMVPARRLGYRFLAAESAWILSGDNRLSTIGPFARRIADTSDDGRWFRGAYGPKFVDQLGYVVEALAADPGSRQAVMTLWRERPRASKDVPCTVALQWLIRETQLHCLTTMRSSDAWLGWPYDVHAFAMMTAQVAIALRPTLPNLTLGTLFLTAGSQHLYRENVEGAERCATGEEFRIGPALDPAEFSTSDELTDHLWRVARGEPTWFAWLTDVVPERPPMKETER